ncbi:unnamed protein product [Paramecium pentaurelia]|uniref:Uncharacterized protein n=1 Tax=Paramecium pentaurelia TaxID=43138 RepID=A0A8S1X838_9CILI|nr:unnamed protein product [Paramecium pentaurelia]
MLFKGIRYAKSYFHGASNIPLTYKTVGQQLHDITEKYPDNLAVVSQLQDVQMTYSEFYKRSKELAAAFIALGLEKGDRIGIFSPNNVEWALTQFAAAMADLILVNINPAYQTNELEYTLNKVGCKALILRSTFKHSNYVSMIKELAPELDQPGNLNSKRIPALKSTILIDDIHKKGFFNFKELFSIYGSSHLNEVDQRMSKQDPDDITNIQFTSGTTGAPKGACLSHLNILNNGKYVGERVHYTSNDRIAIAVPLYHCFGMVMGNLACINYGSTMVYPSDGFSAGATLEAVTNYKCTSIYGVPTMFIEYLNEYEKHKTKYDVSTLRTGLIAGSLASEALMKQIINVLGVRDISNCYGQTETSPVTSQTKTIDSFEIKTSKVGQPMNMEVKIVDSNGKIVPYDTPGEYCSRGYAVMKGYWGDEKATKNTIDENGFLHSGDLATMDKNGYVAIVGRIKDMIIRGGENIYPKEIEDYLSHLKGVEQVQVVGCFDEKYGEEVVALIKMKKGAEELSGLDVYQFCHKKIAHYKIPKYVKFVNDFPYTVTGKPQKFKMRDEINKELEDPKLRELYQIK